MITKERFLDRIDTICNSPETFGLSAASISVFIKLGNLIIEAVERLEIPYPFLYGYQDVQDWFQLEWSMQNSWSIEAYIDLNSKNSTISFFNIDNDEEYEFELRLDI
jgi:hypothetical protein